MKAAVLMIIIIFSAPVAFTADSDLSEKNLGKAELILPGGTPGDVPFPHRLHQETLKDCNLCHDMFPREKGVIEKLKAEDKLRRKQVMNAKCTKCHRDNQLEGKNSGPVTCSGCHSEE